MSAMPDPLPLGRVQCRRRKIVDKRGDLIRYECGACGSRIPAVAADCPSCRMGFFGFTTEKEARTA